jgi:hypothetical protein
MVRYPDVTILIQGPVKDNEGKTFMTGIHNYKELTDKIVLSTWSEQIDEEVFDFVGKHNVLLCSQSEDIQLERTYNIGFQTLSVWHGLQFVKTKYCLKVRTDEKFCNLEKLIERFLQNDNKWVSGCMFFTPKSECLFHAADHLFIARTDKLLKTFESVKNDLEKGIMERNYNNEPAAEVTFTKAFLRASGEEPEDVRHDELMRKYFDLMNDEEFYPFVTRFNHGRRTYDHIEYYSYVYRNMKSMDDVLNK